MTPIEKIHETDLRAADEAEIAALMALCFDTDFGGRSFFRTRHHLRLVIRDHGQITAHMALQFRAVRLGGRLVDIAALAEVATHPLHRGKGLAGQLLQAVLAEARQSRAEYVLLFGTAPLYTAAGFRTVHNPMTYVQMDGAVTGKIRRAAAQVLQVLPLGARPWDETAPLDVLGGLF